jgi:hypothetical protein
MVKFAVKEYTYFANIRIEPIRPLEQVNFPRQIRKGLLRTTVKRLNDRDWRTVVTELGEMWGGDAESVFANALPSKLTLHAEMQLLYFYELYPELTPIHRAMGTSKKACFCCQQYMNQHSPNFKVSACHQKVYPTWLPPHYFTGEDIWKFSKQLERSLKEELNSDLRAPRHPRGRDSTAGPSLTATATVVPTEKWTQTMARVYGK